MTRAVVLARGLGTRMREEDARAPLTREQQQAADAGLKAMMPVNGHPFLAYVLSAIADSNITAVALVVAPDHDLLVRHFVDRPPDRTRLSFVVQPEPLGTANAVLAVERWVGDDPFLVMNADNLYPAQALSDLVALEEPGFPAFDAEDLVASSNIPPDRVRAFALAQVDRHDYLTSIVEKPRELHSGYVSMNCWRFDARIFDACRDVPPSVRGEFELPEAVGVAVTRGLRVKAVRARGPVLDLSRRADAADVARRLARTGPRP